MPTASVRDSGWNSGTTDTELVYRKQIRPVVQDGATAMDKLFPDSAA
jgi:hypothetical protein